MDFDSLITFVYCNFVLYTCVLFKIMASTSQTTRGRRRQRSPEPTDDGGGGSSSSEEDDVRNTDNIRNTDDELFLTDSDEEIDFDTIPPVWSINTMGMRQIEFVKEEGFLVPLPEQGRPIDFFNFLLDDVMVENIVRFTNANAMDIFTHHNDLTPKSRIHSWKDVTVNEMKTFLGLFLHTGTIKLNRLNDYWKTHWLFSIQCFSTYMSRDRFLAILRCLYFKDKNTQYSNERLAKIQHFVDYFNSKMETTYYPQKELSLDESMILWRGRLIFRQYLKGKKHKYGIKLYTLSDPHGLILRFLVYCGVIDELAGKGHAANVVLKLMERKLDVGHSLYMDNYYNSFLLASKLLSRGTYCTGTLRIDRKFTPTDVKSATLKKGETIARYAEGVCIAKWKDKRVVSYISTEFENDMVQITNKREILRDKPLPIVKYNAFMKGIDRGDQMMAYYPVERKTLRWYKKLAGHIIHMLFMNAHILHNIYTTNAGGKKWNFYDFRLSVLEAMLPKPVDPLPIVPLRGTPHTLTLLGPRRDDPTRTHQKDCRVCRKNKLRKKSKFVCKACPGEPGLCPGKCFDTYHQV